MFKKDPLQIIAFQGYGTDTHFYARGRALEDESIDLENQNTWHLIVNTWKRFETDEIKNVGIKVSLPNGKVLNGKTDRDGYFKIDANLKDLSKLTNNEGWLSFELSYNDANIKRTIQNDNKFPGEILIPSTKAQFGVASDIDDTILHTGVVSTLKWKVIYNSVFKHAKNRIPLEGAAGFYHKLHRGVSGQNVNPIFYVSHSPWNLYRYLELFLRQHDFPKGPILLRNLSNLLRRQPQNQKPQKEREIINLLKTYPNLPFILIGDSGENDPDIYIKIAEEFPKRILAIYLRSVKHKAKMKRVKSLLDNYKTTKVLLVESSAQAIKHAKEHNFIA
ncbi:App1 family protein [Winogradskyella aquimaris]|uniref:Phosphatase domain-containing protein n=1 Tax=Winogradskyella aquimaris TaxID=864074 RepID=A0ABU5EJW7_9FLAO|nr:phosphatase domain-containing protein [Winogradskyella aquimaris]MDY2585768.1 phosphatase domain-containing protein [Winogradskyella aquimaris]